MKTSLIQPLCLAAALSLSLSACQTFPWKNGELRELPVAGAAMEARSASFIRGVVQFRDTPQGLVASASLTGLTGTHSVHIHANPNCEGLDANGAGPVHVPLKSPTGSMVMVMSADIFGAAKQDMPTPWLTLNGENAILGRSLVVHAGADPKTPRVACGVILPL